MVGRHCIVAIVLFISCIATAKILPESSRGSGLTETKITINGDVTSEIPNNVGVDVTAWESEYHNDVTERNNRDNATSDDGGKRSWVLLTNKYTKKYRITDFTSFKMDERNILGSFSLENEWKRKILSALKNGETTVKPSITRPVLKSATGNELTILSNDVTMRTHNTQPRVNITCPLIEEYSCTLTLTRQVIVPCWIPPHYQCFENTQELRKAICRRKRRKCCAGYEVGTSGYCEIPKPVIQPTQVTSSCGGYLTSREGVITSPNYPTFYPNDQNCKWRIQAPRGFKVILKVIDLGIEEPVGACDLRKWQCFKLCEFDRLKIIDVTTRSEKTLCGYRVPTTHYVSSGDAVEIIFKSDVSSGGRGFNIVYATASEHGVASFHPECTGGQIWRICHERCARTCQRYHNGSFITCTSNDGRHQTISASRRNEITCVPACACPPYAPIWHNGRCIKPESCPGNFFQCGKPAVASKLKIVGGRSAGKHAWPWMVQLESDSIFHICGATLVCSNWVITAAHCFLNMDSTALDLNPRRYLVNVGKFWKNEQQDGRTVQTSEPEKIIIHPNYRVNMDTKVDMNDIALIRLSHAVDVTDYVRPACLPQPTIHGVTSEVSEFAKYQQPTTGTSCKVLGWGTTRGVGPTLEKLKETSISIQPGSSCVYSSYRWPLMICAGGHKNQDTCRGDSGGPLLCKRGDGKWFLDGVTSFGDACGEEGVAGGYTRVSSYIGWIRRYVGYKCEA